MWIKIKIVQCLISKFDECPNKTKAKSQKNNNEIL